ncbi:SCO family protein [Vulgatibacter incomptus]|uniref:Cytochrome oxidase biogenesis protein Sco1/SenC/PrrC, copper metallochaperone n=1 Tax=Vulgatibacter incomptus TaxID=1391653 RepID=A0A0K1PAN9_9BACT|nr:SCO family protein [Vulgatibacter incomptus]AKU90179.1 hypothetical protein AKJ08_0566 [Vulgatibacter incomptus]
MRWLELLTLAALLPMTAGAEDRRAPPPARGPDRRADSLYLLGGGFTDQDGKQAILAQLAGKPVLISMFYSTCKYACPLLIGDIRRIEEALEPRIRAELRVVLVTLDPERDTPDVLRKLRDVHALDPARWTFLHTDATKVRELAEVLGIHYRVAKDGAIGHSSVITLLDKEGAIAGRVEGVHQPIDLLVAKIRSEVR